VFKKIFKRAEKTLKTKRGGNIVTLIIITAILAIISVGVLVAIKPDIQSTQSKVNTQLNSAGNFNY
jgi:competence protein ComGC